ncbi:hypothetical protein ACSBR1_036424 [Camellia fascicularis]
MRNSDVQPDVFTVPLVLRACAAAGSIDCGMRMQGVKPNDVTFLGVLSACTHGGLVETARSCFKMMKDYGVVAELKHYACMIDCLGRAGLLIEAERLIEEMPMKPDGAVLGALLGGCRVHGNLEVGERIAKRLIGLEPERTGTFYF